MASKNQWLRSGPSLHSHSIETLSLNNSRIYTINDIIPSIKQGKLSILKKILSYLCEFEFETQRQLTQYLNESNVLILTSILDDSRILLFLIIDHHLDVNIVDSDLRVYYIFTFIYITNLPFGRLHFIMQSYQIT